MMMQKYSKRQHIFAYSELSLPDTVTANLLPCMAGNKCKLTTAAVFKASTDVGRPIAYILRLRDLWRGRLVDNDNLLLLLLTAWHRLLISWHRLLISRPGCCLTARRRLLILHRACWLSAIVFTRIVIILVLYKLNRKILTQKWNKMKF